MSQRRSAISLNDFVKAKQHDSSYARKLQQKKSHDEAKIKRNYRAALKKEGYSVDKKRVYNKESRDDKFEHTKKRPRREDDEGKEASGAFKKQNKQSDVQDDASDNNKPKRSGEKKKLDRFAQARLEAEERENERIRKQKEREERAAEAERKRQERKSLKRKLTRKTPRGQPILRHKMDHILSKLEKEAAEEHAQKK